MVVSLIIWLVGLMVGLMVLWLWYDGNDGRFDLCVLKTIIFLWLDGLSVDRLDGWLDCW